MKTLRQLYEADFARELARRAPRVAHAADEPSLDALPLPVRDFIDHCGMRGMSHPSNARIIWRDMELRSAPNARWMRMACEQVSFLHEPARLALMRSMLVPCLPFDGYDRYLDGRGEMLINLAGVLPVRRGHGRHFDRSALVTYLAEGLLMPSLFLEGHVAWTALDANTAHAELRHEGLTVGGSFSFDRSAGSVRFESEDRWRDGNPPVRQRWSAEASGFQLRKGLLLPAHVSASWHPDGGSFCYMRGTIESIAFDVTSAHLMVSSYQTRMSCLRARET